MIDKIFKNLSAQHQGFIALAMGLILVFGSLGKLGILQGILNMIMIGVGIILVVWGFNASNGMSYLQKLIQKK